MLKVLEMLDREAPSGNPIFLFDVDTEKLLGGNEVANDLFATKHNEFNLEKSFGSGLPLESLVRTMTLRLDNAEVATIKNIDAVTKNNENRYCNTDFTFLTAQRKGILMTVKFKKDFRDFLIKTLLAKKKRPAFLLAFEDELIIRTVNDIFCENFSCTRENIGEIYENKLANLLKEENRDINVAQIFSSVLSRESGMIPLPLKEELGGDLQLYFSKKIIKPLLAENDQCVYCLVATPEEKFEDVEYPFDKRQEVNQKAVIFSDTQDFSYLLGQFVASGFFIEETCPVTNITKTLYTELNLEKFFSNLDVSLTDYHQDMTDARQAVLDLGKVQIVDRFDQHYLALSIQNYREMKIDKKCFQDGFYHEKNTNAIMDS